MQVKWLFGVQLWYTKGPVPTGVGLATLALAWSIIAWATTYPTWVVSPAANPGLGAWSVKTTVMASWATTDATWLSAWPVRREARRAV